MASNTITGSFSSSVGDLNGDSVSELSITRWNARGEFTQVEIYSGADNSLLNVLFSPSNEPAFGSSVMSAGDFDGDGLSDFAIGSVLSPSPIDDGVGIIRVYSGVSGNEIAYIKELPQAPIAPEHFKLLGDMDTNKLIDLNDVILLLANISSGTTNEQYSLDINKDGIVDHADVAELMDRLGLAASSSAESALVMQIQAGEWMIDNPLWPGIETPAEFQPAQLGLVGCAWCAVKCGASWKLVAQNCVGIRDQIWQECLDIYGSCTHLDFSECVAEKSRTALTDCIDRTAGVTVKCAKCIKKCMPIPS